MKTFLNWKFALAINLLLGSLLWTTWLTDLSLRGTIADIFLPVIVALVALSTRKAIADNSKIGAVLLLPGLISGGLYLLIGMVMLIPPFTLGALFALDEMASEVRIQQVESPNHLAVAEVYFRPVGAYTSGSGRISVFVVNRFIPFIERDIYEGKTYTADKNTTEYIRWLDKDNLYISEKNQRITLGSIQPEIPIVFYVPILIFKLIFNQ